MNLDAIAKCPEAEQEAALIEALRQRFLGSLYHTARDLLGYKDVCWSTHGKMIEALEASTTRKLIIMPRGTFKSSVGVTAYSVWLLMRNANLRILIDSEVYENSKNFLREIKARIAQPLFIKLFGDWRSNNWNEGEITIRPRTLPNKEASITCGGIATVKVGQHYDVILEDDLNSPNNSETQEGRNKVIQHHRMNIAVLEPNGIMSLTGTRYAVSDIYGFIMDTEIKKK